MTPELSRTIRSGYIAARAGSPESANPWQPETVGGHAWRLDWSIGTLPPVARAVVAWVLL